MNGRLALLYVICTFSAFELVACGGESKVPGTTVVVKSHVSPQAIQRVGPSLGISAEIVQLCKLDGGAAVARAPQQGDRSLGLSPKFEYDRTELATADREVLARIAECLTTGALKGRSLQLVGRTDPRGEPQYNMSLGALRAGAVADYLTHLGVERGHVGVTSRGELDAEGIDEAGWEVDRRVDITLAR